MFNCDECGCELNESEVVVMVYEFATDDDRSNGPTERFKECCNECAWELFESSGGIWQKESE